MDKELSDIRLTVREHYGAIAQANGSKSCCSPVEQSEGNRPESGSACCTTGREEKIMIDSPNCADYSIEELGSAPEGSNLGLGCGNPTAIASLKVGERVLDLGSGAGFDCFLAARQVGQSGFVIGVDMTPEMVAKARQHAREANVTNVEFRLGEIEELPVRDNSIDVIISNCVINLSTDKPRVFSEAFRVLRPGGRLAISDIVRIGELSEEQSPDVDMITGCIGGAVFVNELERMIREAGFQNIVVRPRQLSAAFIKEWSPGMETSIASATIEAVKPLKKNHGSLIRISY